jgi:hypothetical protein
MISKDEMIRIARELGAVFLFQQNNIGEMLGKKLLFVFLSISSFVAFSCFKLLAKWDVDMINIAIPNIFEGIVFFSVIYAIFIGLIGLYFTLVSAYLAKEILPKS